MLSGGGHRIIDHDEQMERQLSCSICLELFIDPVLLPCLHSLCRDCLSKFCTMSDERSQTIMCPECNTQIDLGEHGRKSLKRNYPLNNLVAVYRQSTIKRNRSRAPKKEEVGHDQPPQNGIGGVLKKHTAVTGRHSAGEVQTTNNPQMSRLQDHPRRQSAGQEIPTSDLPAAQSGPRQAVPRPEASGGHAQPPDASADDQQLPATCCTCEMEKPKMADILCRTCGISFCLTCLSVYHPDKMGHTLTKIESPKPEPSWKVEQPSQCPLCDLASSSMTTIWCVECGLAFCNSCLGNFHPTTVTTAEHTLVKLTTAPTQPQLGAEIPTVAAEVPAAPVAGATAIGTALGLADHSRNRVDREHIIQELAHFVADCNCTNCKTVLPSNASYKCLDCSKFYCYGCLPAHQSEHPGHTIIDVSLDNPGEIPAAVPVAPSTHSDRPPKKAVNVQLKLIELMEVRGDLMTELLTVLAGRRQLLEEHTERIRL